MPTESWLHARNKYKAIRQLTFAVERIAFFSSAFAPAPTQMYTYTSKVDKPVNIK